MTANDAYKYELIVYWSAEDAAFVVDVPELPGCMADGPTPGAAVASAQEAIALRIDTAREFGRAVPEPKGRRLTLAQRRLTWRCSCRVRGDAPPRPSAPSSLGAIAPARPAAELGR